MEAQGICIMVKSSAPQVLRSVLRLQQTVSPPGCFRPRSLAPSHPPIGRRQPSLGHDLAIEIIMHIHGGRRM